MKKVRPAEESSMLVTKLGCSPHYKQGGEIGIWFFGFSMAQHAATLWRKS
jgi:hypothetical protein